MSRSWFLALCGISVLISSGGWNRAVFEGYPSYDETLEPSALVAASPAAAPQEEATAEEAPAVGEESSTVAEVPAAPPAPPFKLVTKEKEAHLRKMLPQVDDEAVVELLNDAALVFYTEEEMPKAYQFFDGAFPGVHAVSYNISANDSEPFGNGNREFPWGTPAGAHRVPNLYTFRFFRLPLDENGKRLPVVWYQPNHGGYAWTFPLGTIFGEVLCMTGPDQVAYAFEMRIRERERGTWSVDVFRPFPTASSLSQQIKKLRPEWQKQPTLVALCDHLDQNKELPELVLADRQPQRRTFDQSMGVDTLPPLDDDKLVIDLLRQTKFRSSLGSIWRYGTNNTHTTAPTTLASFHVVPKNYDAGFVEVDHLSCMRCHRTCNTSVKTFDGPRDWYGRIRGADGIFSFHPFDPGCISHNGFSQTVYMRSSLTNAGLLERFDDVKHSNKIYHTLVDE